MISQNGKFTRNHPTIKKELLISSKYTFKKLIYIYIYIKSNLNNINQDIFDELKYS